MDKSFRDIKKDFSNGLGIKNSLFQTSISKSDWQSLQKFNSAIKVTNDGLTKSQRITKAWNENMTGCSMAAKRMGNDLITGKKKINDVSNAMNTASTSTKALGIAMNVFMNVGFMLAITAVTKVISELAQAQENAIQTAKEATESYEEEIDSINDYKEKLSELHEELNSGNLSYEETKDKRTELMKIQDELIEKFGTEKGAIESVTDAVKGQIDALDDLNEKAYRDWVAKADEQTFWNKLLPGGKSGLDQAIDYMESEQTVSFLDMQNANLSKDLQAIQKEIDETIRSKYNLSKTFAMFNVTGTPEEIKSQLESIRQDYLDLSKEAFLKNGISSDLWESYRAEAIDSINEVINKFDDGLEKHQQTYQTYIEGMIKYDSEYSDEYANILQKRAELETAENSGNEEDIKKARQAFMDAINKGIEESSSNENIKKYFESLYPELQSEFSSWNFEVAIDANTDGLTDITNDIGEKYTATDLLKMVDGDSAIIADSVFNSLIDKAIEYGICTDKSSEEVKKLIDLLVELGIVQGNVQGSTFDNETAVFSEKFETINTLLIELTENASLLSTINKEIAETGRISADNLTKINEAFPEDKYPEMTKTLYQYQLGLISTTELFEELEKCYEQDADNYRQSIISKIEADEEYYSSMIEKYPEVYETLAKFYKDDVDNWKSVAQAKAEIDSKLLSQLSNKWADYFKAIKGLDGTYSLYAPMFDDSDIALTNPGTAEKLNSEYETYKNLAQSYIDDANEAINALNKISPEIKTDFSWEGLSSDSSSSSETIFDWIETKVKNLNDEIDKLSDVTSDVYSSWIDRNNALSSAIEKTKEAIELQQQAYDRYMQEANSVNLSDTWKNLVQNGAIDIDKISNSDLKEKIQLYQDWYENAQDCLKTQRDLANSLNELNSQNFDNIKSEYKSITDLLSQQSDLIQGQIDLLELRGRFANEKYYQDMISLSQKELDELSKEKEQLEIILNSSGIDKSSQEWMEMYSALLDVNSQIQDTTNNIEKLNNSIRDLNWEIFDYLEDSISRITDETSFWLELLDSEDMFDEDGVRTKYGNAAIGLHSASYEAYMKQAQDYYSEMKHLQEELSNGAGKDVLDRYRELVDAHQDAILAANNEKKAILDLVKEGYEAQLSSLNELIDKRKEALNEEKALYDYQKSVQEKTDNISALKKQLEVYKQLNTEEAKSKVQKLQVELKEAEEDLKETEMDRMLEEQEKLLTSLAEEYETWMNERLDNEEALLKDIINNINEEGKNIQDTLNEIAEKNGTSLSDTLISIFDTDSPFSSIMSDGFTNLSDKTSGVIDAINNLIDKVAQIVNDSNDDMTKEDEEDKNTSSSTAPSSTPSTSKPNTSYGSVSDSSSGNNENTDDFFIYKKYYPQALNPDTSIIDRLKKNNYDASFDARAMYYSKMGGNGSYVSSYDQNVWMLKWMKNNGYAHGTKSATKGLHWTQENGTEFILRRSDNALLTPLGEGDMVFNNESSKRLWELAQDPESFISNLGLQSYIPKYNFDIANTPNVVSKTPSNNVNYSCGDITLSLPNVKNYEDFMKQAQNDKRFEKMIQEMALGQSFGNNSFNKLQF